MSYNNDSKTFEYQLNDSQNTNITINQSQKIDLHREILDNIHKMYIDKNHDYGDSVHDTYKRYGLVSFLVRMEDKLNRVRALSIKSNNEKVDDAKVTDEKIEDTLLDLANYAILAAMELKLDNNGNNSNNSNKSIDTHITITKELLDQYDKPQISY